MPGYECQVCGVACKRKNDLQRHMLTHDPNRKQIEFKCPHCPASSLQKHNMTVHIESQHFGRKWQCDYSPCNRMFSDPGARIRHMKQKHGHITRRHRASGNGKKLANEREYTQSLASSSSATPSDLVPFLGFVSLDPCHKEYPRQPECAVGGIPQDVFNGSCALGHILPVPNPSMNLYGFGSSILPSAGVVSDLLTLNVPAFNMDPFPTDSTPPTLFPEHANPFSSSSDFMLAPINSDFGFDALAWPKPNQIPLNSDQWVVDQNHLAGLASTPVY